MNRITAARSRRAEPMPGFKVFDSVAITMARIEWSNRLRKGRFALRRLPVKGHAVPPIRDALINASKARLE